MNNIGNEELNITFVPTNSKDKIGIIASKEGIKFNLPWCFYGPDGFTAFKSVKNSPSKITKEEKKRLKLFLKTLNIGKRDEKIYETKTDEIKQDIPLDAYEWILRDYVNNGLYQIRDKRDTSGYANKINWRKTLKTIPMISDGNIIYNDVISEKYFAASSDITDVYLYCVKISMQIIGFIYNYNFHVNLKNKRSANEMLQIVKAHLRNTFDVTQQVRLQQMYKIIRSIVKMNEGRNKISYSINNYDKVFEEMLRSFFDNVEDEGNYKPVYEYNLPFVNKISSLQPDIIIKKDKKIYVIDAKMYQYESKLRDFDYTKDYNNKQKDLGLPGRESVEKQIAYAENIEKNFGKECSKGLYNVFVLPFNKEANLLNDENSEEINDVIRYCGYIDTSWADPEEKYSKILIFAIDLDYLQSNYKNRNAKVTKEFCEAIEKYYDIINGGKGKGRETFR